MGNWVPLHGACESAVRIRPQTRLSSADRKQSSPYNRPEDWGFASPWTKGKQLLWPDSLLKRWIKPAANRVGIEEGGMAHIPPLSTLPDYVL
jgi:hypothetical protein